jgi:tetratricopeptide (TPR) repeat protein
MEPDTPSSTPPVPRKRSVAVWLACGLVAALAVAAFLVLRGGTPPAPPAEDPDPRLTYSTPFLNVRPEVQYVGDQACARCHEGHAASYAQHSMGRSFFTVAQTPPLERFDAQAHNPFERFGSVFTVERQGQAVHHKEVRKGRKGEVVGEVDEEIHYSMGSGVRGRSYLIDRDGYLFQSPVSWYSQKQRWDLSPGFSDFGRFERPIVVQCLFCHANDANHVEHSLNRYRRPIFKAHAIGCERCHGPGELHVRLRDSGGGKGGVDHTIVNPRRLDPPLREAVCQQCHLQPEVSVVRRGRQQFDYRPGLPLHLFLSMFVRRADLADRHKAVAHVEQMQASRCFQASAGKLGCSSCHDPHRLPAQDQRVAFYRGRCLECHADRGCALPPAVRHKESREDNCAQCHMARFASSDIVHTAVTDHRILRKPEVGKRPSAPYAMRPGEVPLAHFHADLADPKDRGMSRDLGVALMRVAASQVRARGPLSEIALPLLEAALEERPDDVSALLARAEARQCQGQHVEALADFDRVLARAPRHEQALTGAALSADLLGRADSALRYWQGAVAANPWLSEPHAQLAKLYLDRGEWKKAADSCRAVLRFNPQAAEMRMLLAVCQAHLGDTVASQAELDRLEALNPPHLAQMRQWFKEQTRPKGQGRERR